MLRPWHSAGNNVIMKNGDTHVNPCSKVGAIESAALPLKKEDTKEK
jgi:hypothetical protein